MGLTPAGVSPQNQHIGVFGVIIAPAVYRLGQILKREDLKRMGIRMFRSCGQITDPYGSQGECPFHTNYGQGRGGYKENHTPFWITAHILNAGAQFAELGVDIWR